MAENILSENYYSETRPLFKWNEIKKVLEDHKNSKEYNLTILWALLAFQVWSRLYNIKLELWLNGINFLMKR